MTKYEFNFKDYDYKMEYDEEKSSNEWSIDEETSYLFYKLTLKSSFISTLFLNIVNRHVV